MSVAIGTRPHLLHSVPGRARLSIPGWRDGDTQRVEAQLCAVEGVTSVRANALTGNVLVHFDPHATDAQRILAAAGGLQRSANSQNGKNGKDESGPNASPLRSLLGDRPRVLQEGHGHTKRARISVNGLDRDPDLSRRVVERLERHPGVHARANPLTGRVLVEYDEHQTDIEDLLADVSDADLPDLPGQDQPTHPLDPAPLVQSASRTAAAAAGFGILGVQQAMGTQAILVDTADAATAAGALGLIQGIPVTRDLLRRIFGRHLASLLFEGAAIVILTLSGNALGLAVSGAEALRLLTEVVARRRAWRRYEEKLGGAQSAQPGTDIRLESGQRTPLKGKVVQGTGTATGHDGLPTAVSPGSTAPAGAQMFGGPFVLALQADESFVPQPRPASPTPTLYDRYLRALGPLSLAYAGLTAVTTLSLARTFNALLLVNPRTAVIGTDDADTSASARVLRDGVTVVDTRPDRMVQLPTFLLLHEPRILTDGYEVDGAVPLGDDRGAEEMKELAIKVADAAGAPWGAALTHHGTAAGGSFDGQTATASIDGARYTLGQVGDGDGIAAEDRERYRDDYLLVLRDEGQNRPLGLLALRPRLRPEVGEVVGACARHGVTLELLTGGNPRVARAVANRAAVPLVEDDDAVAAIRARQERGALVGFVSDNAHAAPAFAACDLAIGVTAGQQQFPARADLLAPDLRAVAEIVDAGAQRQHAMRDSVVLSALANAFGVVWGFRGAPGVEEAFRAVYVTSLAALADGWVRLRGRGKPVPALLPAGSPAAPRQYAT